MRVSATGLLDGLVIDPQTGLISGTLSCDAYDLANGQSLVTVTVTDSWGHFSSQSFVWTVADVAVKNVYWTGAGDGVHWNDIYNWDILDLPECCDEVFINDAGITVLHEAGDVSIHSLHSLAALDFTGGLELATASSVSNDFAFDGTLVMQSGPLDLTGGGDLAGTIIVQAGAEINFLAGTFGLNAGLVFDGQGLGKVGGDVVKARLEVKEGETITKIGWDLLENGEIGGLGTLKITEELKWLGGAMVDGGKTRIDAGAALKISGNGEKVLDGRTIENAALVTWTGTGAIKTGSNAGRILNLKDAEFDIQADVSLTSQAGARPIITNEGIFKKSAGSGTADLQSLIENGNDGTITAESGTLKVLALDLNGGLVNGNGTLLIATDLRWRGGNMDGGFGTTQIAAGGFFGISGPAPKTLTRNVDSFGTVSLQSDLVVAAGVFRNFGQFNFTVPGTGLLAGVAVGTFENRGNVDSQAGTNTIGVEFNNRGQVTVDAGTLILRGNGLHTGTFTASSTAIVLFDTGTPGGIGTNVFDPNLDDTDPFMLRGDGLYVVTGGARLEVPELAVVEVANVQLADQGVIRGDGTLRILTSLAWSGGSMVDTGVTEIARDAEVNIGGTESSSLGIEARTLLNYGTINWIGQADIVLNVEATFVNDGVFGGGFFIVQNSRAIRSEDDTSALVLRNDAQFIKAFDQQTSIRVLVIDEGARYQIFPFDVTFERGYKKVSGITHVAGNALTIIGDYEHLAGDMLIEGGSISISGTAMLKGGKVVRGGGSFSAAGGIQFMGGQLLE